MYVRPYNGTQAAVFAVGVMEDPNDVNTFDTVQTFVFTATQYHEIIVPFDGINDNFNIAIRTNGALYVDDITIDLKDDCFKVNTVFSVKFSIDSFKLFPSKLPSI